MHREPEIEIHYLFLNPGSALTWSADLCKSIPGRAVRTLLHYGRWKAHFFFYFINRCFCTRMMSHALQSRTDQPINNWPAEQPDMHRGDQEASSTDAGRGGGEHSLFGTTSLLSDRCFILSSTGMLHPRPRLTAASLLIHFLADI